MTKTTKKRPPLQRLSVRAPQLLSNDSVPNWRRECFRTDLDPLYADKVYGLLKECYEAAMAHPDWDSDGERAFCVNSRSRQKTPKKLLAWYRARRDDVPTS